jgi:hypothetical protein
MDAILVIANKLPDVYEALLDYKDHIPMDSLKLLADELRSLDKEFSFDNKELDQLLDTIKTGPPEKVSEFINKQKEAFITPQEIFGREPTKLEHKIYKLYSSLPQLSKDADIHEWAQ